MLLDTCALLWLATGSRKLSRSARSRISTAPAVYVSAISGFEISIKCQKGKLQLALPTSDWFNRAVQQHDLTLVDISLEICIRAAELPSVHPDPCDRFIIATAKLYDWEVVTVDERFEKYNVRVID